MGRLHYLWLYAILFICNTENRILWHLSQTAKRNNTHIFQSLACSEDSESVNITINNRMLGCYKNSREDQIYILISYLATISTAVRESVYPQKLMLFCQQPEAVESKCLQIC